jgi:hypothetical protein
MSRLRPCRFESGPRHTEGEIGAPKSVVLGLVLSGYVKRDDKRRYRITGKGFGALFDTADAWHTCAEAEAGTRCAGPLKMIDSGEIYDGVWDDPTFVCEAHA